MRIPRGDYLPQHGATNHVYWRAHDKSHLLDEHWVKNLFIQKTVKALEHKSVNGEVELQAFCVMSNHSHQLLNYKAKSKALSDYMRIGHGAFALIFNYVKKRHGAVVCERPKTPVVQDSEFHNMRVHFYIEANPIRAGMVKSVAELKGYAYCSYRFYAWGIKDKLTSLLKVPQWYTNLGKSDKQRQSKYRSLFDKYLKDFLKSFAEYVNTRFIGDPLWVIVEKARLKKNLSMIVKNDSATSHPPPR